MKKRNTGKVKLDRSEKQVKTIAYILMGLFALAAIIPCMHVIAKSLSHGTAVIAGKVTIVPIEPQMDGYLAILKNTDFLLALANQLWVTIVGVIVNMTVSVLFAYPLSKSNLYGKKAITICCMVAMTFSGGTIPTYLVVRSMGMLNSFAALIIPSCMSIFDMLILKNYFESLPDSVLESASLDGASEAQTLMHIVLPMSTPVIATVSLLYAIGHWNSYFPAMLYLTKPNMITLQVFIKNFISSGAGTLVSSLERTSDLVGVVSGGVLIACISVLGIIPIITVYPFVQKYLQKGMTIGSVKG